MLFSSVDFILFYIITFILYYSFKLKYQRELLFLASVVFIWWFSYKFLIISFVFISINYGIGLLFDYVKSSSHKKLLYTSGLIFNIAILLFYKYVNFIIENLNSVIHFTQSTFEIPYINVILPLGISFYTFQGIGYIYRLYKIKDKPERDFINFGIFMLFFPKFLSGPIERHEKFIPQLRVKHEFDYDNITSGFRLILWGYFKKLIIADTLSIIIENVYGNLHEYTGVSLIITLLIQPVHIYCDFSGYTDIALGVARTFGIKLTDNFERPFLSQNVGTFWRRWHISLSSWCNTFIYNPTILKRKKWGKLAASYALTLTFLVIGIWHGARWNYIILGVLQAIAINYEFYTKRTRIKWASKLPTGLVVWISRGITYVFFGFSLIFFNSVTFNDAIYFISHLFQNIQLSAGSYKFHIDKLEAIIAIISYLIVFYYEIRIEKGYDTLSWFYLKPMWVKWMAYFLVFIILIYYTKNQSKFVYSQF